MGLQVQPPRWLSRTPAVHGHRDQVGPVLVVADDHAPRVAAAPAGGGEPQRAPLSRARRPQSLATPGHSNEQSMNVPEGHDEPPRWEPILPSRHTHISSRGDFTIAPSATGAQQEATLRRSPSDQAEEPGEE